MTALVVAAAGLLVSLECVSVGDWPLVRPFERDSCPQVYQVHGYPADDTHRSLDIVVVADAFTEDSLDDYRCAVALMIEKLLATPPYRDYHESINVYRVDLAASKNGVEFPPTCGGEKCRLLTKPIGPGTNPEWWRDRAAMCAAVASRSGQQAPLRGRPLYQGRPECIKVDIDAQVCPPGAEECQLLWPTQRGTEKLWKIATCTPDFDFMIVLANTGTRAGGGTDDAHPPLAVATLNGIGAWWTRSTLLAHEMGHALGLLDEYSSSQAYTDPTDPKNRPTFHSGRNILQAKDGELARRPPWGQVCTKDEEGRRRYEAGECYIVCNRDCDTCDFYEPPGGVMPKVGAVEGGFYRKCGYFKAAGSCMMNHSKTEVCGACTFYLDGLFKDLGMTKSAEPYPIGFIDGPSE